MTFEDRHAAAKAEFQALGEQKQALIQQLNGIDQKLIRADEQMVLLEQLMKERDASAPSTLVPSEEVAS